MHKRICDPKSRYLATLIFSSLIVSLTGCASSPSKVMKKEMAASRARILKLERSLNQKQSVLNEMRAKNAILEKRMNALEKARAEAVKKDEETETQTPRSNPQILQNRPTAKPVMVSAKATGEQRLYSKVLESFRKKDSAELQTSLQILLKTYPDSVFADNALYVAGLLAYEARDMKHASEYMERVLREYPSGNKAVSALLAKAMIEKQMPGRAQGAKESLRRVRKLFPGSPEARLAQTEERLMIRTYGLNRQEF